MLALSNGYNNDCTDIGNAAFNSMFWYSSSWIIQRRCSSCTDSAFSVIYYRRYTKHTAGESRFNPYEYMCCNWFEEDNVQGVDFDLFSRYDDALAGTNAWAYCNYDDGCVGFPRDCGPEGDVNHQWNSFSATWDDEGYSAGSCSSHGGQTVAFYLEGEASQSAHASSCCAAAEVSIISHSERRGGKPGEASSVIMIAGAVVALMSRAGPTRRGGCV